MTSHFQPSSKRGSILIVSLIFAAITGVALASYIALCSNSLRLANRSFYSNSAINAAEMGIEQALARYNELDNVGSPAAWPTAAVAATATEPAFSGWTLNSGAASATGTYSGLKVGPNTTATVKLYAHYYDGSGANVPVIVAKSIVQSPNGKPLEKYLEVTLRKRSSSRYGLVAYNDITWSGVPTARSWNSDPDNNPATPAVEYAPGLNTANATVASINGDVMLGSGTVYGYAKVGPDGTITGGTVRGLTGGDDAARRTNDFNATFPAPSLPSYNAAAVTTISSSVTGTTTYGSGTGAVSQVINGKTYYVYVFTSGGNIDLHGNTHITTSGNVMFIMQGKSGTDAINITGNQGVIIPDGSSMEIYTDGNIKLAGNNTENTNASPSTMLIKGLNPTSQTITISGTADIKAIIDAPKAAVSLAGTVSFQGACIANTINMNGTPDFMFDEAAATITAGNPYGISKWKELQSISERSAYNPQLNF